MTLYEVTKILEDYNRWRRGAEIEQPNPKIIGEAIDLAIETLKKQNYK